MRTCLIFLVFCCIIFSQYSEPPISNVTDYNLDAAESLEGHYNASLAQNSTLTVSFDTYDQDIPVSVSIDIAGLSLLVDNTTHAYDDLSVITARGYSQGHLTAIPSEGYPDFYCDAGWFAGPKEYPSRCDFDMDYCAEYEKRTFVIYDVNATFTFAEVSESVPMESNVVEIPSAVLDAMATSSGADSLNVTLEGDVEFIYEINDRVYGAGDCSDNIYNSSVSIPVSINRSFTVCGENKLFFLVAPALREQWFRNNHFNVAVLSQSPLYEAKVYEGKNITRNITLRTFSIIPNSYGLQEIISNRTLPDGWVENSSFVVTPIPLEMTDSSFSYAYLFNYSYTGLGEQDLSLLVKDSFGGSEKHEETVTSVMLSYNGSTTETGSPIGSQPSRKSLPSTQESLVRLDLSLGLVALLLLLAFVNSWLWK